MVNLFSSALKIIFIALSCIILAYISMAASVGPWISPAIILLSNVLLLNTGLFNNKKHFFALQNQAGASFAGLVSTAIGFCLPTLYFLDTTAFKALLDNPLMFCLDIGLLIIAGGLLGTVAMTTFGASALTEASKISTSKLFAQTHTQSIKRTEGAVISLGVGLSGLICLLRDGLFFGKTTLFNKLSFISFYAKPTMWAVGYILGTGIIKPILIGIILQKIFITQIAANQKLLGLQLSTNNVAVLSTAFCCGVILFEIFFGLCKTGINKAKNLNFNYSTISDKIINKFKNSWTIIFTTIFATLVLKKFDFNFFTGFFIVIGSIWASIEIANFLLAYGMVPFGRFATFVMLPSLAVFSLSPTQITILCIFVSITCAATSNFFMQRGVSANAKLETQILDKEHWLGIFVASILAGGIFWLLLSNLSLGSAELFAQRGQMRAILISTENFEKLFVFAGAIFGLIFQQLSLPISMILGGLLMPLELSFALVAGACIRIFFAKTPKLEIFWTGIFAGEAIFVITALLFKLLGNALNF